MVIPVPAVFIFGGGRGSGAVGDGFDFLAPKIGKGIMDRFSNTFLFSDYQTQNQHCFYKINKFFSFFTKQIQI